MTPCLAPLLTLLLALGAFSAVVSGCKNPNARPPEAKDATVEAKFTSENPHFEGAGTVAETPEELAIRTWWNALEGSESQPIEASTYTTTAMLRLPFGVDQATVESSLPGGWHKIDKYEPIYDPLLLDFTSQKYTVPQIAVTPDREGWTTGEVTLGFDNGRFGDLRLLLIDLKDGGQSPAEALMAMYGKTAIEKIQEPDPAAKTHRKMITLTWRVTDEGKRSGFISYQVTFAGPIAGSATQFLQPGDKFVQASFTTMSPDMMTALRAANPVGSGTTP